MIFYKETNFKETPIGKIPEDWAIAELQNLIKEDKFAIVDGPFGTQLHSNDYIEFGIPLVRVHNINEDGTFNSNDLVYISEKKFEELKRSAVFPGDIIIAKTGSLGRVCIFPSNFEKGLIASSCAKISIDTTKIDNKYVFYFLLSKFGKKQILSSAIGSTRPTINLEHIKRIKIIFPQDIKERQKIVEILSTVDSTIQKVNEIIAKTERLKKGLMKELLTGRIRAEEKDGKIVFRKETEFKEDAEIGKIPKDWEVVKLETIFNFKNGRRPEFKETGKIPVYGANGIMGYTDKFIVDNDFTLVIGRVGAPGEVHLGQGRIWISDNAIYSENYKNSIIYPPFAYYMLKFKELNTFASKTTHPLITQTFLNNFQIPLPSINEQQKIAEILLTIDKKLELERKRKEKIERIKKGLMDLLLTGKVRVKV
jgi:type I restriction enzyme, S subunit